MNTIPQPPPVPATPAPSAPQAPPQHGPIARFFIGLWNAMNFTRQLIFNLLFFFLLFLILAIVFAVVVGSTLLLLTAIAHQSLRARRQQGSTLDERKDNGWKS